MRIAIPNWQGRISPVFDVASRVLVIDIEGGTETCRREVTFDIEEPQWRANKLAAEGVSLLVCGAISKPQEQALLSVGVEVLSQTCGNVERVVLAFIDGCLGQQSFVMPGCSRSSCGSGSGRRRRRRGQQGSRCSQKYTTTTEGE